MAPKKLQTTQWLLTQLLTLPLTLLLPLLTLRLTLLLLTLKLLLNNPALHNAKRAALGRLFLCAVAPNDLALRTRVLQQNQRRVHGVVTR